MVDVRYFKEMNYGYIIDMYIIVKFVIIKVLLKSWICIFVNIVDVVFF